MGGTRTLTRSYEVKKGDTLTRDALRRLRHSEILKLRVKDTGGKDNPAFDDWTHPQTLLKGPTPKVQDGGAFRAQDLRSLAGKVLRLEAGRIA